MRAARTGIRGFIMGLRARPIAKVVPAARISPASQSTRDFRAKPEQKPMTTPKDTYPTPEGRYPDDLLLQRGIQALGEGAWSDAEADLLAALSLRGDDEEVRTRCVVGLAQSRAIGR